MEETMEEAMEEAGGEGMAVANAVGGDFAVHRRLVLAVAMEVGERGGGEDLTAGNAAGEGVGRTTAAGGGAGGAVGGGVVGRVGKGQSMMFFLIIAFNSSRVRVMTLTYSLVLMKGRPMRSVEAELQVICKQ